MARFARMIQFLPLLINCLLMQLKKEYSKFIEKYPVLYKYVPIGVAIKILEAGTVKFSKCKNLNDPFEYNLYSLDSTGNPISMIPRIFKLRELGKSINILSLSTAFDIIPLWSHYADGHRGACIGYDTKFLINSIISKADLNPESMFCLNVKYSKIQKPICAKGVFCPNKLKKISKTLLERKSIHWKYENEVRIVLLNITDIPITIGTDCIKKIYVGCSYEYNDDNIKKEFLDLTYKNYYNITSSLAVDHDSYKLYTNSFYPMILRKY